MTLAYLVFLAFIQFTLSEKAFISIALRSEIMRYSWLKTAYNAIDLEIKSPLSMFEQRVMFLISLIVSPDLAASLSH